MHTHGFLTLISTNLYNQRQNLVFWPVMCNSNSGIGTGIGIPGISRAYGIGIRIDIFKGGIGIHSETGLLLKGWYLVAQGDYAGNMYKT